MMNNKSLASCWCAVCLAILVVGLLLLSNVPNAYASTYRNATSCDTTGGGNAGKINGTVVSGVTSPVTGIEIPAANTSQTPQWEKVGEISLMWSETCQTNWVHFDPIPVDSDTEYVTEAIYLYSKGGGSENYDTKCSAGEKCESDAVHTGSAPAQVVASLAMAYATTTDGTPASWQAYGIASQY